MGIVGFARRNGAGPYSASRHDPSQLAVVSLSDTASAAVLGAPGTGKTTTIVEVVADRVLARGWSPDDILVLTPTRATATKLRDALALRLAVATNGALARTVNSFAFEVAGVAARAADGPALRLVTGGDQDADVRGLLEGNIEDGSGPHWTETLGPDVRGLRGFRTELRETMMRATEYRISPARIRELARAADRPEWAAVADFIDEYLQVITASRPGQLDAAELAQFASAAIRSTSPGERVERLRLVIVDDLQEATESTLEILRALASRGIPIIACGDPDVSANAFRGGEPDALGRLAVVLSRPGLETLTLSTAHRQGPALRSLTAGVTARIGAAAAGRQRAAIAGGSDAESPIARVEATGEAGQWAAVARALRERHVTDGFAWSDLAVIVRSGAPIPGIARALALAEVPNRTVAGGTALRDEQAARALLAVVDVGVGRSALTPETATELLLGPFGGLDRLALRRLRLALRAEELAGGGIRTADDLLVDALEAPGRLATIDHRVARAAERLAGTLAAVRASSGSIEELLWIVWERSGLVNSWSEQALGGGITATEANRNLDGVVALFTVAKRFVERRPDGLPVSFLAEVLEAEIPEDTLSPQPSDDAVLITTPSGAVGLEFDTVVVATLQDGAWPNLRLRGSLLGPQELVRAHLGVDASAVDERKQVLGDELRMFALAVSRARSRVILSAVANEDQAPSVFLGLLPDGVPVLDSANPVPLTLRGLTGRLRRQLVDPATRDPSAIASSLAALAREQVPGASPQDWHGLIPISSGGRLYETGEEIRISPSALEKISDSPLDWFLEMIAGGESGVVAGVGTILHWAMETSTDTSVDALWAVVESRWSELVFDAPWLAERQKRIARGFAEALGEYLADFEGARKVLVGSESRFELEVGDALVSGSIDRVERDPEGAVVIVDLKTGAPITSPAAIADHPQLLAYQLAYAEGKLDDVLTEFGDHHRGGAKLLFVREGVGGKLYRQGIQEALTDEQLEEFRDRIRLASTLIAQAEFEGAAELDGFRLGDVARLRLNRVKAVSSD